MHEPLVGTVEEVLVAATEDDEMARAAALAVASPRTDEDQSRQGLYKIWGKVQR